MSCMVERFCRTLSATGNLQEQKNRPISCGYMLGKRYAKQEAPVTTPYEKEIVLYSSSIWENRGFFGIEVAQQC